MTSNPSSGSRRVSISTSGRTLSVWFTRTTLGRSSVVGSDVCTSLISRGPPPAPPHRKRVACRWSVRCRSAIWSVRGCGVPVVGSSFVPPSIHDTSEPCGKGLAARDSHESADCGGKSLEATDGHDWQTHVSYSDSDLLNCSPANPSTVGRLNTGRVDSHNASAGKPF